jgi:alpha-1,4-digalacturonate transport system substrate-binding protein
VKSLSVVTLAGLGLIAASNLAPISASAQELVVYCIDANIKCSILEEPTRAFEAANPGITVKLELITNQAVAEALPVQLEAGEGPDASISSDLAGLRRYYLDLSPYVDAKFFEAQYGQVLSWMRDPDQPGAINGLPESLTVGGAYVNLTLFEQAGVEVPGEGATWDDWAAATKKVAEATGTAAAMEMDRTGHRFAALAISEGAELVDDAGNVVVDDGLKRAIQKFVDWHKDGTMPADPWAAVGGTQFKAPFEDFLNAKTVFYFGGSWGLARMGADFNDAFEWKVVPTPCGVSSCTAMPGGGAFSAFKGSKHPAEIAKYLAYLAQPDVMKPMLAKAVQIPAATSLIESGITYEGITPATQEGLATFTAQIPKMAPAAFRFQGWRFQRAMMNAMATRISQAINDELTVDDALARIKEDVEIAMEASKSK